jgi:hypothetical protein
MRARAAMAMVLLASVPACRTTIDFSPIAPSDVRAGASDVAAKGSGRMRDANGDVHEATGDTPLRKRSASSADDEGTRLVVSDVINECVLPGANAYATPAGATTPCPLDDRGTKWDIGRHSSVPDFELISGVVVAGAMIGGFVAWNVVCFGGDGCSDTSKTGVIVTDVVVGVSALLLAIMAYQVSNYRGD